MSDEIDTTKEFQDAVDGVSDRRASLEFWGALSRGEFNDETLAWIRIVAGRILDADDEPKDAERRAGIIRATGLHGKFDNRHRLRLQVQALRDFGASRPELLKYVRDNGLFGHHVSDKDILDVIDRELRKP